MSNYTKLTDFASKDALPTGSPAKIVKGTEIDDEFQAIENAVVTKADISYVDAIDLSVVYPVGSVYINAGTSSNPATLLGFGTWARFGEGKVLVSQDSADTSFDTLGETGGSKDAVNVSHSHSASTSSAGSHNHNISLFVGPPDFTYTRPSRFSTGSSGGTDSSSIQSAGNHSHTVTVNSAGESGTNKNLQPYVVVYMWQRTA